MNMKKYWIFLLVAIYIPRIVFAANSLLVKDCDNSGKSDASACIQAGLDMAVKQNRKAKLQAGEYLLQNPVILKSNLDFDAKDTVFIPAFTRANTAVLVGNNVSNLTLTNIRIKGSGMFYGNKFRNPYAQEVTRPWAIGFSNADIGIYLGGLINGCRIENSQFSGLAIGIIVNGVIGKNGKLSNNIRVSDNKFYNMGSSAIKLFHTTFSQVTGNSIAGISGNMVVGKNPALIDSKFGDGIYTSGIQSSLISGNRISNVIRAAIVLEGQANKAGQLLLLNRNIIISNNEISKVQGSRGTEENGGVWIEGYTKPNGEKVIKSKKIYVLNNVINNTGAIPGAHSQYGIIDGAESSYIGNNKITNFSNSKGVGIVCTISCVIEANVLSNNKRDFLLHSP